MNIMPITSPKVGSTPIRNCSENFNKQVSPSFSGRFEVPRNIKKTGFVPIDAFRRLPVTMTLSAAACLTSMAIIFAGINSSLGKYQGRCEKIAEVAKFFETTPKTEMPQELYERAKNTSTEWDTKLINTNIDGKSVAMVETQFNKPKKSFLRVLFGTGKLYDSSQDTPRFIKCVYGLNDGVLRKYNNNLEGMLDDNTHGHSHLFNFDDANDFKLRTVIRFPKSEIGENIEAAKQFYSKQAVK